MTEQAEHRVEIVASVSTATATELVIDYSIANRSNDAIYVFDIVARFDQGKVVVDDHAGYLVLDRDGSLRIMAALLKLTKRINATPPILVSVVEAGQVRRNTLRFALPLHERHPYFPIIEGAPSATTTKAASARLQIGWVEQRGQGNLRERKVGDATFHELSGNWGSPLQRIRTIELALPDLPVVPYPQPLAPQTIFVQ